MKKVDTWKGELIGKTILVIDAQNKSLKGLEGEVIDETRNMLEIQTKNSIKRLVKNQVTIKINKDIVQGKKIIGRIEERIKK